MITRPMGGRINKKASVKVDDQLKFETENSILGI